VLRSRPLTLALTNDRLAEALKTNTEFSEAEWREFGIEELTMEHYIKVEENYFIPDDKERHFKVIQSTENVNGFVKA